MEILLWATSVVGVYIYTFQKEFKEEDLGKLLVYIIILTIILIIFSLIKI